MLEFLMAQNPLPRNALPLVIPSSMVLHTPVVRNIVAKNPRLARDVIAALNGVDRSRNLAFREVMGDRRVKRRSTADR